MWQSKQKTFNDFEFLLVSFCAKAIGKSICINRKHRHDKAATVYTLHIHMLVFARIYWDFQFRNIYVLNKSLRLFYRLWLINFRSTSSCNFFFSFFLTLLLLFRLCSLLRSICCCRLLSISRKRIELEYKWLHITIEMMIS